MSRDGNGTPSGRWTPGGLSTERIKALSDGVFAFAITLLILSIGVPQFHGMPTAAQLNDALAGLWPRFLTYALSFVIIGIYWVGHNVMFHHIKRSDRPLLWINIALLLCIAFIPFPTALMGQYWRLQIADVCYGGTLVVTGLLLQTLWWYATSDHRLVDRDLDPHLVRMGTTRNLTAPALYLIAIALSFVGPVYSLIFFVLVPALYVLPGNRLDHHWAHLFSRHRHEEPTPVQRQAGAGIRGDPE